MPPAWLLALAVPLATGLGCAPGAPGASSWETVCEEAADHVEACTGEYITPPVCDDQAARAAERMLAVDCEHFEGAFPADGKGDGAFCEWFGTGCKPDEPIFRGAACERDADCHGGAFCVEQHCFDGVTSAEFAAVLDEYTDSLEVPGNYTDLLVDNVRTREVWRDLVTSARQSIHLAMHGIKDDEQGRALVERLIDAAARGVEVRVLIDAATQHRLRNYAILSEMAQSGIHVLPFNPPTQWTRVHLGLRGFTANDRLHEKMVIVDGRDAILGGRNVGDAYLTPDRWRDVDVHVRGPAVAALQHIFLGNWDRTSAWERRAGCPSESSHGLYCPPADPSLVDDSAHYPELEPSGEARVRAIYSAPFLQDVSHGYFTTLALVRGARESIQIANAYCIPPRRLRKHLRAAAARGVEVTIITNSKESNNFVATYYAGLNYYRELIDAGIHLYEYDGPETLHAKVMLVDGEVAVVGSYNLDVRSADDNSEAMVLMQEAQAVEQLRRAFDATLDNSTRASADIPPGERARALAHRIVEPLL